MGQKDRQRLAKRKKTIQKKKEAKPLRVAGFAALNPARSSKYDADQCILVLGDGDFSFSRGLVKHRNTGKHILATAYDDEHTVTTKYNKFAICKTSLERQGARVQCAVDATKLSKCLGQEKFDRIIFNFPHSGKQRVHINRVLLKDFLGSAKHHLTFGGQIHVTLKDRPPYSNWELEESAVEQGLCLIAKLPFKFSDFPGYKHVTTLAGAEEVDTSVEKHVRVWHFGLPEELGSNEPELQPKPEEQHNHKRKRKSRVEKRKISANGDAPGGAQERPKGDEQHTAPAKKRFVVEFD